MEAVAVLIIAAVLALTIEGLAHVIYWAEQRYGILLVWVSLVVFCALFWSIVLCILVNPFSILSPRP